MSQEKFTREELAVELVTIGDVAAIAGVPVDTVQKWRTRHADFPAPIAETLRTRIYLRREVVGWLGRTGRLPAAGAERGA
jgi:hypothetical protein